MSQLERRIVPNSVRGRMLRTIAGVFNSVRAQPSGWLAEQGRDQGLTADQMLIVLITEAVVQEIGE